MSCPCPCILIENDCLMRKAGLPLGFDLGSAVAKQALDQVYALEIPTLIGGPCLDSLCSHLTAERAMNATEAQVTADLQARIDSAAVAVRLAYAATAQATVQEAIVTLATLTAEYEALATLPTGTAANTGAIAAAGIGLESAADALDALNAAWGTSAQAAATEALGEQLAGLEATEVAWFTAADAELRRQLDDVTAALFALYYQDLSLMSIQQAGVMSVAGASDEQAKLRAESRATRTRMVTAARAKFDAWWLKVRVDTPDVYPCAPVPEGCALPFGKGLGRGPVASTPVTSPSTRALLARSRRPGRRRSNPDEGLGDFPYPYSIDRY